MKTNYVLYRCYTYFDVFQTMYYVWVTCIFIVSPTIQQ